jgi:hypothetical protein
VESLFHVKPEAVRKKMSKEFIYQSSYDDVQKLTGYYLEKQEGLSSLIKAIYNLVL